MDLVRHILNSVDHQLDTLSKKSILIEPSRYAVKNPGNEEANSLNIFLKIGDKKRLVLGCNFDENTSKLLGFSLIGGPEKE